MNIKIDRWIDITSDEYQKLPDPKGGLLLIKMGLRSKALMTDKDGRIFSNPINPDGEKIPLNDNYKGQVVGFRDPAKAAN